MDDIVTKIHARTKLFLCGPFGSGKTTLAIERVHWLLRQERVRGDEIMVLTPQRTVGEVYYRAFRGGQAPPGPPVFITTVAGLARNALQLYWPLIAAAAGFANATREPTFLDLETSQYHMARFVDAALEQDEFSGLVVERNRIISQILDNLNKSALQNISPDDAYQRLELAVPGGDKRAAQINALRAAHRISMKFRELCLQESLVDYSLQMQLFSQHILTNPWSRAHLLRARRHLIVDNVEEDTRAAHLLAQTWLPLVESALIIRDNDAGYRLFLGADPEGGEELAQLCDERIELTQSHVTTPAIGQLARQIDLAIVGRRAAAQASDSRNDRTTLPPAPDGSPGTPTGAMDPSQDAEALVIPRASFRFYPQMIAWVAEEIRRLVRDQGIAAGQIAVLAPFVSDALRFSLQTALTAMEIPSTTHRPSRALQDEPAARCLLTLTQLAHPGWGMRPASADVSQALALSIDALDPVRAQLLTSIVYPERRRTIELGRFAEFEPEMRERITYVAGESYDRLREWLYAYRANSEPLPLDQLLARLFGELLSQPGYGFHNDFDAARVANQLVDSARNFRWALEGRSSTEQPDLGRDYVHLIQSGALGALYPPGWRETENAVFLAPAYTFLMRNRSVDVQFWLDVGAGGWWERLYQPLTHPYVLSHRWPAHQPWSDLDEYQTRQATMHRLLLGLVRRARRRVYLGISEYSESGYEQRGPLLSVINRVLALRGRENHHG